MIRAPSAESGTKKMATKPKSKVVAITTTTRAVAPPVVHDDPLFGPNGPLGGKLPSEPMPLTALKPYAKNPRIIPESAIRKVAASIRQYGFRQPIVVDEQMTIVVGHTRYLASMQLAERPLLSDDGTPQLARDGTPMVELNPAARVPVHVARGLTKAQVKAYRLADNRVSQESSWEMQILGEELGDLRRDDFDLDLTGFDQMELDRLLHETLGIDFPDLPDGDKSPFEHMTFTLHASQAATVREALDVAKKAGGFTDSPNENGNGNALTRIAEASLGVLR